jgi:hypothetical protein
MHTMKKGLLVVATILFAGAAFFSLTPAHASASVVGIQLCDNGENCNAPSRERYADLNAWTDWAGDGDRYDPDYMRVLAGNTPIPTDTDIRIGIQALDDPSCWIVAHCSDGGGKIVYTHWASEGGGWSYINSDGALTSWATDVDGWDPDLFRIIVETRPLAGKSVTGFSLEVQVSNSDMGPTPQNSFWDPDWDTAGCGSYAYPAGSDVTPYSNAGGGWTLGKNSGWAGMEYNGSFLPDPNCFRVKLTATVEADKPATTLHLYKNGVLTLTPGNAATVAANDSLVVSWNGNNNGATSCEKSLASPADFTVSGVQGSSPITSPAPGTAATYSVRCANAVGWGTPDTLTITRSAAAPVTTLYVSVNGGAYTPNDTTINQGDQITISIESPNSASCTKVSGPSDFINPWANPDNTITEPTQGNFTDFAAYCSNGSGAGNTDTLRITTKSTSCSITKDGTPSTLLNGQSTGLVYLAPSVPYGTSCPSPASYRCNAGTMSGGGGSYYTTCSVQSPPPQDAVSLSVDSTLVRAPSQVKLTWNGGNSTSCSITANGTQIATGVASPAGGFSYTVTQKTIFLATCAYTPLNTSKVSPAVTVNVVPVTQEI